MIDSGSDVLYEALLKHAGLISKLRCGYSAVCSGRPANLRLMKVGLHIVKTAGGWMKAILKFRGSVQLYLHAKRNSTLRRYMFLGCGRIKVACGCKVIHWVVFYVL